MTPTTRRRLHEHVLDAVLDLARQALNADPTPERREELAQWVENTAERVRIVARVDRNSRKRVDTRSLTLDVYLDAVHPGHLLCSVRVRDLLDAHGHRLDAPEAARDLLWQNGIGIPDDASSLTDPGSTR